MNIFLTSPCPRECAIALDNVRLSKMVLETAQLLATTCHMMQIPAQGLYRKTHWNHPCALFARKSFPNFQWLVEHGLCLSAEFSERFGGVHSSEDQIVFCYDTVSQAVDQEIGLTAGWHETCNDLVFSFNCSGFDSGNVFEDYKSCLRRKWDTDKRPPQWPRRGAPDWR